MVQPVPRASFGNRFVLGKWQMKLFVQVLTREALITSSSRRRLDSDDMLFADCGGLRRATGIDDIRDSLRVDHE